MPVAFWTVLGVDFTGYFKKLSSHAGLSILCLDAKYSRQATLLEPFLYGFYSVPVCNGRRLSADTAAKPGLSQRPNRQFGQHLELFGNFGDVFGRALAGSLPVLPPGA